MSDMKNWKVFMVGPDGANRTLEFQAETKDKARKIAERQADDIAEEHGGEAYTIKSVAEIK